MSKTIEGVFTIGQAAKEAGVNIQTLRFYERRGLLKPTGRRESGYRLYSREAVQKVHFIKNAQGLGFTLKEVGELLRLGVSQKAHCGSVQKRAEFKCRDVHERIQKLKRMEQTLRRLVHACQRRRITEPCPILRSLENG